MDSVKIYLDCVPGGERYFKQILGGDLSDKLAAAVSNCIHLVCNHSTPLLPTGSRDEGLALCEEFISLFESENTCASVFLQVVFGLIHFIATKWANDTYFESVKLYWTLGNTIDILEESINKLMDTLVCLSATPEKDIFVMIKKLFRVWRKINVDEKIALTMKASLIFCLKSVLRESRCREPASGRYLYIAADEMIRKLMSENKQDQVALSADIFHSCSHEYHDIICEILCPAFESDDEGIDEPMMEAFKSTKKVYSAAMALLKIKPELVVGIMGKMMAALSHKKYKNDVLTFLCEIFSLQYIPSMGSPRLIFSFQWQELKRLFSKPISNEERDIMLTYSSDLLKANVEWFEVLAKQIELQQVKYYKGVLLSKIIPKLEQDIRFFLRPITQSYIAFLINIGSPGQLEVSVKRDFIQRLCKVYISFVSWSEWKAASDLIKLILLSFYSNATLEGDISFARILVKKDLITKKGGLVAQMEELLMLYSLVRMGSEGVEALIVLREVLSAHLNVRNIMRQVLDSEGEGEQNYGPLARKILLHMRVRDIRENFMVNLLKRASENRQMKELLQTLMDFKHVPNDVESSATKLAIRRMMKIDNIHGRPFMDEFFALIEPLVNRPIAKELRRKIRHMLHNVEEGSQEENGSDQGSQGEDPFTDVFDKKDGLDIVTLTSAVSFLRETLHHSPYVGFAPGMLGLLLELCDDQRELAMALECIYLCGESDEGHWNDEEKNRIRSMLLKVFDETTHVAESDIEAALLRRKWVLRCVERVLPREGGKLNIPEAMEFLRPLVSEIERGHQSSEQIYVLSISSVGYIAALPGMHVCCDNMILATIRSLGGNLEYILSSALEHEDGNRSQYDCRFDLPQDMRVAVQELRTLGRCLRYGVTDENTDTYKELGAVAKLIFGQLVNFPASWHDMSHQRSKSDSSWREKRMMRAAWIRFEAGSAALCMLENPLFQDISKEDILALTELAMEPETLLREMFCDKLLRGLLVEHEMTISKGRSKGNLPPLLSCLLALCALEQSEIEWNSPTGSTVNRLTLFVRSQRRHLHFKFAGQSVYKEIQDYVRKEQLMYLPENIILTLIPILSELDFMEWYINERQIFRADKSTIENLKKIAYCFDCVLRALSSSGSLFPRMDRRFLQEMPDEMLKFMSFKDFDHRRKQVLLCCILKICLKDYTEGSTKRIKPMTFKTVRLPSMFYKEQPTPRELDLTDGGVLSELSKILARFSKETSQRTQVGRRRTSLLTNLSTDTESDW